MLPRINDILCATDLSDSADNALRHAMALAVTSGAKIHVLHVSEPLSQDAVVTLNMFMQDAAAREKALNERHASIKAMLKENQKRFVARLEPDETAAYATVASVELVDGYPAEMILKRARELKCGLIVMASHEHATVHTYMGSVVKRVLRRSTVPTLVVPQQA